VSMSDPSTEPDQTPDPDRHNEQPVEKEKTNLFDTSEYENDEPDGEEFNDIPDQQEFCCKVSKSAEKYNIYNLDKVLTVKYKQEDASLRDIEEFFNQLVIGEVLRAVGPPDPGDLNPTVDEILETINKGKDEAGRGDWMAVESRLAPIDMDPKDLKKDLVSFGTVRKHLRECLDVDTSKQETITPDSAAGTVGWARTRAKGVSSTTIERLQNADKASITDPSVTVTITITCQECGYEASINQFLSERTCNCLDSG